MRLAMLAVLLLGACGGKPLLYDAPRPNPKVAAGIVAGMAAAATIADPNAYQRQKEAAKVEREPRSEGPRESIPDDVLDRLDQADAGVP